LGEPKRTRKTYSGPGHPWQKQRIEEEAKLKKKYAYKNKKELWKVASTLRNMRAQARKLLPLQGTKQGDLESKQLINKLIKYGIVPKGSNLNDILNLTIENFLDRRLQTLVFKAGLANSIKQARQFITHGHVYVGNKKITSPSYLVKVDEEKTINIKEEILKKIEQKKIKETQKIQKEIEAVKEKEVKSNAKKE